MINPNKQISQSSHSHQVIILRGAFIWKIIWHCTGLHLADLHLSNNTISVQFNQAIWFMEHWRDFQKHPSNLMVWQKWVSWYSLTYWFFPPGNVISYQVTQLELAHTKYWNSCQMSNLFQHETKLCLTSVVHL